MLVYLILFGIGFANEALLTAYYTNASKGRRWLCVGLSLLQQVVACVSTFYNLVDVIPGSKEQIIRCIVSAVSYGFATYVVVKPTVEKSDVPEKSV